MTVANLRASFDKSTKLERWKLLHNKARRYKTRASLHQQNECEHRRKIRYDGTRLVWDQDPAVEKDERMKVTRYHSDCATQGCIHSRELRTLNTKFGTMPGTEKPVPASHMQRIICAIKHKNIWHETWIDPRCTASTTLESSLGRLLAVTVLPDRNSTCATIVPKELPWHDR